MGAGAEVGALGHHHPLPQVDGADVVTDHLGPKAGLGGHGEVPGGPDAGTAVHVTTGGQLCPEAAQQPGAPGVQGRRGGAKQQQIGELPEGPGQAIGEGKAGLAVGIPGPLQGVMNGAVHGWPVP